MKRLVKDMILVGAIGAVGYCAYKWMSPSDKEHICRDARRTAEDMGDVKEDIGRMAETIKKTF